MDVPLAMFHQWDALKMTLKGAGICGGEGAKPEPRGSLDKPRPPTSFGPAAIFDRVLNLSLSLTPWHHHLLFPPPFLGGFRPGTLVPWS